jgi:hypothetical protein
MRTGEYADGRKIGLERVNNVVKLRYKCIAEKMMSNR